jgi:hypothetical protein
LIAQTADPIVERTARPPGIQSEGDLRPVCQPLDGLDWFQNAVLVDGFYCLDHVDLAGVVIA